MLWVKYKKIFFNNNGNAHKREHTALPIVYDDPYSYFVEKFFYCSYNMGIHSYLNGGKNFLF